MKSTRKFGFTLVEILVTITIIAILATAVVVAVGPIRKRAAQAQMLKSFEGLFRACESYKQDNNMMLPGDIDSGNSGGGLANEQRAYVAEDQLAEYIQEYIHETIQGEDSNKIPEMIPDYLKKQFAQVNENQMYLRPFFYLYHVRADASPNQELTDGDFTVANSPWGQNAALINFNTAEAPMFSDLDISKHWPELVKGRSQTTFWGNTVVVLHWDGSSKVVEMKDYKYRSQISSTMAR